jgi:hypothetical protein
MSGVGSATLSSSAAILASKSESGSGTIPRNRSSPSTALTGVLHSESGILACGQARQRANVRSDRGALAILKSLAYLEKKVFKLALRWTKSGPL